LGITGLVRLRPFFCQHSQPFGRTTVSRPGVAIECRGGGIGT
jgi:hypothetical protein